MSDLDAPDMVSEIMDIADPERHPIQVETWACVSARYMPTVAEVACCCCRACVTCPVAVLFLH